MKITNKANQKRLFTVAKPYLPWIIIDKLIRLACIGYSMIVPWLIQSFILEGKTFNINWRKIVIYFVVGALLMLLKSVSTWWLRRKSMRMLRVFRTRLFARILHYPISFFRDKSSDELTYAIVEDSKTISEYVFNDLPDMIVNCITMLVCISFLFSIDYSTAFVLLCGIPVCMLLLMPLRWGIVRNAKKQKYIDIDMREYLASTLEDIEQVKISCSENYEIKRGKSKFRADTRAARMERFIQSFLSPMSKIIGLGLFLVVGGYAVSRIINGYMTVGSIIAFALYFSAVLAEVVALIMAYVRRDKIKTAVKRMNTIYGESVETYNEGKAVEKIAHVALNNINFAYGDRVVLDDISFDIKQGELVALVGASGCGKSTILGLLERFYIPQDGFITVNGGHINLLKLSDYRLRLSYVTQHNAIVGGTVRDNILYGNPDKITDQDIMVLADKIMASQLLNDLSHGLDTDIIENGSTLSGGQCKKITLLRELLKDTDLLLLDEPTASLDSESEKAIMSHIYSLKGKMSVVMVAHRLSTVVQADKIVLLKEGKISAIGTHSELMNSSLYYQGLVAEQSIASSSKANILQTL